MRYRWIGYALLGALALLVLLPPFLSEHPNNPYPPEERAKRVYYSSFAQEPKHLDPAISYSSDEGRFLNNIYEPIFQYSFLKRPYQLEPLTCVRMPEPSYFDEAGEKLPDDVSEDQIAGVTYEIDLKPGIFFQKHPCFAKDSRGEYRYHSMTSRSMNAIWSIKDFEVSDSDTRELTARDYVYQIKRLCLPNLAQPCPVFGVLSPYIKGMRAYHEKLRDALAAIRATRREAAGALYNQELDERQDPIVLDLNKFPFEGAEVVDKYTYRLHLTRPYPQILFWMAMNFFAPVPEEAVLFYAQPLMVDRGLTLDRCPVGTGAFRVDTYNPNRLITLVRNENYHEATYPREGEPGDKAAGYLDDAGERLPLMEKVVYTREKESVPYWIKFIQGYYDSSGLSSDNFDQAVRMTSAGNNSGAELSPYFRNLGIRMKTARAMTVRYYSFNMLDEIVGGLDEAKCKLRQAIAIALDTEEYLQIFRNGRGLVVHNPIPRGIFGGEAGQAWMNRYAFDWDDAAGRPRRKSIDEARRLLAEAGYPGGLDAETKQPLVINYDTVATSGEATERLRWVSKQMDKIGVRMRIRSTDYNTFREKVMEGNYALLSWGWLADYPDPENFLFLLYGPNGKAAHGGENVANYDNPEYNRLFEEMSRMPNSPERLERIRKMSRILQHDAPWFGMSQTIRFNLYHGWVKNNKINSMAGNKMKYIRIDPEKRARYRAEQNQPMYWPVYAVLGLIVLFAIPPLVKRILREEV